MRTIKYYHEEDDSGQNRFYFCVILFLVLFLLFLFSIPINLTFPLSIMKTETGLYQTYLPTDRVSKIKAEGVFYTDQGKYRYTRQVITDSQVIFENTTFILVNFQLIEDCQETIISGRILISRNTIFDRIINLWKGDL